MIEAVHGALEEVDHSSRGRFRKVPGGMDNNQLDISIEAVGH